MQEFLIPITQGFAEFLPVSSSLHVELINKFLWIKNDPIFLISQVGTFLASIVVFFPEIRDVISIPQKKKPSKKETLNLARLLEWPLIRVLIASSATLFVALLASQFIPGNSGTTISIIMLIFLGLAFLFFPGEKQPKKTSKNIVPKLSHTLLISMSQVLALIPGSSRLGVTILTTKLLDYKNDQAYKLSFILSIPIVGASILWEAIKLNSSLLHLGSLITLSTFVLSFVLGLVAGSFLKKYFSRIGLLPFGLYRIFLGILLYIYL